MNPFLDCMQQRDQVSAHGRTLGEREGLLQRQQPLFIGTARPARHHNQQRLARRLQSVKILRLQELYPERVLAELHSGIQVTSKVDNKVDSMKVPFTFTHSAKVPRPQELHPKLVLVELHSGIQVSYEVDNMEVLPGVLCQPVLARGRRHGHAVG
eukprot:1155971-Pelagomonas_calceolata.AAC.2